MNPETTLYLILLLGGLLLVGAEIFLPGGLVGLLGAVALLGAAFVGGSKFAAPYNLLSVALIIVLAGIAIYLWIRFFPKSRMGRKLTLNADGSRFTTVAQESAAWLNQEGQALSALRPAGLALVQGRRVDVVAESSWIPAGARIGVIAVEGNRIVVRQLATPVAPKP
ncbi:MAG: NfeD family protein [Kiritimatiellaeota bacterium]|nr:NfeD family protein [Kiritimatiellota bacterium]